MDTLSSVLGWGYFTAWSVSFLPQLWRNQRRRNVTGLSMDFVLLNLLGFACLAAYCAAFRLSDPVREAYRRKHDDDDSLVSLADLFFAVFAFLFSFATLIQACTFPGGLYCDGIFSANGPVSWHTLAFIGVSVGSILVGCVLMRSYDDVLDLLYFLSLVKMIVTLTKYTPQLLMNYRTKSMVGWSIKTTALDFTGGILSLAQLFVDAARDDNWDGITGDPIKFGLGFVSIFFDIMFFVQYRRYRERLSPSVLPTQPETLVEESFLLPGQLRLTGVENEEERQQQSP